MMLRRYLGGILADEAHACTHCHVPSTVHEKRGFAKRLISTYRQIESTLASQQYGLHDSFWY